MKLKLLGDLHWIWVQGQPHRINHSQSFVNLHEDEDGSFNDEEMRLCMEIS